MISEPWAVRREISQRAEEITSTDLDVGLEMPYVISKIKRRVK
jgi:hypothetical protein